MKRDFTDQIHEFNGTFHVEYSYKHDGDGGEISKYFNDRSLALEYFDSLEYPYVWLSAWGKYELLGEIYEGYVVVYEKRHGIMVLEIPVGKGIPHDFWTLNVPAIFPISDS